jgi:hypothetical protein
MKYETMLETFFAFFFLFIPLSFIRNILCSHSFISLNSTKKRFLLGASFTRESAFFYEKCAVLTEVTVCRCFNATGSTIRNIIVYKKSSIDGSTATFTLNAPFLNCSSIAFTLLIVSWLFLTLLYMF